MKNYIFEYLNENDYKTKERTLRKYNMLGYKKLTFDYYDALRNGNLLGEVVEDTKESTSYELNIPADKKFEKVHGEVKLHYTAYKNKPIILLTNITPEDILAEAHSTELNTYKGVIVSKSNPEKDIFKLNLLDFLQK